MINCKKVKFINQEFADKYIAKLNNTSNRKIKPVRSYLCEVCFNWHLTSIESRENKELIQLNRQIANLKSKLLHCQNEITRLNKIILKNSL